MQRTSGCPLVSLSLPTDSVIHILSDSPCLKSKQAISLFCLKKKGKEKKNTSLIQQTFVERMTLNKQIFPGTENPEKIMTYDIALLLHQLRDLWGTSQHPNVISVSWQVWQRGPQESQRKEGGGTLILWGIKEPSESWGFSNRVPKATQKLNRNRRRKRISRLDVQSKTQKHTEMLLLGAPQSKKKSLRPGKNEGKILIALGVGIMREPWGRWSGDSCSNLRCTCRLTQRTHLCDSSLSILKTKILVSKATLTSH